MGQATPDPRAGSTVVEDWQRELAGCEVVWVNAQAESGLPYDILIRSPSGAAVKAYIEVKSSSARQKDVFEVSRAELNFAAQHGARYQILRVSGACSPEPSLTRLVDPIGLCQTGVVSLCLLV
ncbi:DUF3883 domain-containing protein, partial [Haematococcus lacustris]